jgi:hypothetical protein
MKGKTKTFHAFHNTITTTMEETSRRNFLNLNLSSARGGDEAQIEHLVALFKLIHKIKSPHNQPLPRI